MTQTCHNQYRAGFLSFPSLLDTQVPVEFSQNPKGAYLQVLIHIGDAKCGSSSIQGSLFRARQNLRRKGILYHPATAGNGHYSYITLLNGRTRGNNALQADIARKNIAETRAIIKDDAPDYLLLSAENLFGVSPVQLSRLVAEIAGCPQPMHVIVFLRHPVDLFLSTVQQSLKADHEILVPPAFTRDMATPLRRWLTQEGCEGITARLFDRASLTGGSVVAEFASILRRITCNPALTLLDVNENSSLSVEQMILLQRLRRDVLADSRGKFRPESNQLIRLFHDINTAAGRLVQTKPVLREDVQACVNENNAGHIAEIDSLFPDLGMASSRPVPECDWKTAADQWTADVASILNGFDENVLANLEAIVPTYNPALTAGESADALRSLDRLGGGEALRYAYARYLRDSGHDRAATMCERDRTTKPDCRPAKVLLLGTSNTILRGGWVSGFTEASHPDTQITNGSVGGSPSTQFAVWCERDMSGYDYVIFDAIVNDENMVKKYLGDFDHYANLLHQILSTIASQTRLVVLGFCNERFAKNRSQIYRLHRDLASKVGGEFVSVIDHVLAQKQPGPIFRDGAHIALDRARAFGSDLAQKIHDFAAEPSIAKSYADRFRTVHLDTLSAAERVTRQSSLFTQDFLRLRSGDEVTFAGRGNLIGFQIDASDTYGYVELSGPQGSITQSLRFRRDPTKFLAFFIPVAGGFAAQQLKIVSEADTALPSPHEEPAETLVDDVTVAISTVTFWDGP